MLPLGWPAGEEVASGVALLADCLFSEGGYLDGYYEEKISHIRYRNVKTDGIWEGSWSEMRGKADPVTVPDGGN